MTNPNKVGLVLGALVGAWHFVWSLLVLWGWAQSILNFIFWAHMIRSIYVVKAFDPTAAATLMVISSLIGYLSGYIAAVLWNKLQRTKVSYIPSLKSV